MSDLISRQAAIKALYTEIIKRRLLDDVNDGMLDEFDTESILRDLPSVEPERKTWKWIKVINPDTNEWYGGYVCSECWRACVQMSMKYCANCGAPMEVQDEY